jgi:large conductance mechanosensitive channel
MLSEFRKFILRGNVLDLAVAVVIGAAFGAVVDSLVEDVFTPILAAIVGEPDFSGLAITMNDSQILYGSFINSLVSLLVVAVALFFLVVKPLNALQERMQASKPVEVTMRDCPECLSSVPVRARRCLYCTAEIGTAAAAS